MTAVHAFPDAGVGGVVSGLLKEPCTVRERARESSRIKKPEHGGKGTVRRGLAPNTLSAQ